MGTLVQNMKYFLSAFSAGGAVETLQTAGGPGYFFPVPV
jgi:hypothetical protein